MYVEMTIHAQERIDRLAKCVELLGMSSFIVEARDSRYPGTIRKMTTTGIILVFDEQTNRLITGYMATMAQMHLIYRQAHIARVPEKIYKRVYKNNTKYSFLNEL